ncbi:hypothetical protein [Paenibacillus tengchongensis]|uniref:hypothetical protein n=1 Tax=Paenibacillus tengchongensis TaxID=2608684 RepID=UPI00124D67B1|nr:hypothetical protein [Paenibacillus tengchongensis]
MKRWIDVDPLDWFYRDTLEMSRLTANLQGEEVISGLTYNVFEPGHERIVKRFITVEGQQELLIPDYKYQADNPLYVLINGVEIVPEAVEDGKVTLSNPLSAGLEIVCIAYGKPALKNIGCVESPYEGCANRQHPSAELKHKASYVFSFSHTPETCTVLGVKLKRLIVTVAAGENAQTKIYDAIADQRDVYVIHKGTVYLPYMYKDFPAVIGYNAVIRGSVQRKVETVIAESPCVRFNDRFFPNVRLRRGEFFALMSRILENIHNRYTDRQFAAERIFSRAVTDQSEIAEHWYGDRVLSLLEQRFIDGYYVFPLYADGKFEPEACITRAETVTYLNRFIEWVTERYR